LGEIVLLNAVVASWKPESRQLPRAYPAQYGSITYPAAFSYKTDRDEFWGPLLGCFMQDEPPYYPNVDGMSVCRFALKNSASAFSALAVFDAFEVYESNVTVMSQDNKNSSHKCHSRTI
jgi:hypothetical protein